MAKFFPTLARFFRYWLEDIHCSWTVGLEVVMLSKEVTELDVRGHLSAVVTAAFTDQGLGPDLGAVVGRGRMEVGSEFLTYGVLVLCVLPPVRPMETKIKLNVPEYLDLSSNNSIDGEIPSI